jgi:glycosyltransferase involved in cell wall biosynthesis
VGFESAAVPYTPAQRNAGKTHFNTLQLMALSLDGITAFSTWPLRAVSVMGFVFALFAFCFGVYTTLDYFINGNNVSGWPTIVVALTFFSGIQLISIGIVGEYVGRNYEEAKRRPLYIIKDQYGKGLG